MTDTRGRRNKETLREPLLHELSGALRGIRGQLRRHLCPAAAGACPTWMRSESGPLVPVLCV